MLNRIERLYVAFTSVATGAVAVVVYVVLVASELFAPAGQIDWLVATVRLVESCAVFYGVTYLAAQWIYCRIEAAPELEHITALSAQSQVWLNGMAALLLLVAQITLAVRAGGLELAHVAWIAAAGILLIASVRSMTLADQREIDELFAVEPKSRVDPVLAE